MQSSTMDHQGKINSSSSTPDIRSITSSTSGSSRLSAIQHASTSSFDSTDSHPPSLSFGGKSLKFTSYSKQNVRGIFRPEAGKSDIQPVVTSTTSGTSASSAGGPFSHVVSSSSSSTRSLSRVRGLFPFTTPPTPSPPSPSSPWPPSPRPKSISRASCRGIEVCPGLGWIEGQLPLRTSGSSTQAHHETVKSFEAFGEGKKNVSNYSNCDSMNSALAVEAGQHEEEGGKSNTAENEQNAFIPHGRIDDIVRPSSMGENEADPAPVETASTKGATSLETIDDETLPPNHLSFMGLHFDSDEEYVGSQEAVMSTPVSAGENSRTPNSKTEYMAKSSDPQVDGISDPVAIKIAQMADPKINAKRWTRFGGSMAETSHSFDENKSKKMFGNSNPNIATQVVLETHNSDSEPVPIHYLQLSTETGFDDGHSRESQAVKDSKGRQSGSGEGLPYLETCTVENLPVPLHYVEARQNDDQPNSVWVNFENSVFHSSFQRKGNDFLSFSTKEIDDKNRRKDEAFLSMLNKDNSDGSMIVPPDADSKDSISQSDDSQRASVESSLGAADEQGATDQERRYRLGNNQEEYRPGLAVASPVDEPDLYEAVEYDPFAKTPTYHNRKYLCLEAFALLVIGAAVSLSVVFGTKEATTRSGIKSPAQSSPPSFSPTSGRELSGITEEVEENVLRRGATFQDMTASDPRILALEWILYDDEKQLEVFDFNLHQRYVLALLAFSLDSVAWKNCGDSESADKETGLCNIISAKDDYDEEKAPWLSGFDECDWYGVTCIDGFVWQLKLDDNYLIGEIVPEVASLGDHLGVLDLTYNCLYGTLPPEIGNMKVLEELHLESNSFSGIFPEQLYDLSNLVTVNIGFQKFNGWNCSRSDGGTVDMVFRMGDPENDDNLGFEGNFLSYAIGNMHGLQNLAIEGNSFKGSISSEIGKLSGLVHLGAAWNFFSGSIPTEVTKLQKLTKLFLEENDLTGKIPEAIGRIKSLESFSVWQNRDMTGTIPDSLYDLASLDHLNLAENNFHGILSSRIGKLSKLEILSIHNNQFSGTIPSELGLCDRLYFIQVDRNNFDGSFPEEVCQLQELTIFTEVPSIHFKADCLPINETSLPLLQCDCCNTCCDTTTGQCKNVN
mmetsp:Transcript_16300/g.33955  ORF Transcript_16300/g.33955 Transcript_16300/m.33955 type:complete len:1126 (-) Transcript_16300:34-3411(-)